MDAAKQNSTYAYFPYYCFRNNAYKHGTPVDVFKSALRGAGPMALMLGHEWPHIYEKQTCREHQMCTMMGGTS
jgi:hypothetical protein